MFAPDSQSEMLSRLRADQSERWHRGERVFVESYLLAYPHLASDDEALIHLVFAEWQLRVGSGDSLTLDEYLRRFPQHADSLRRLWEDLLYDGPTTQDKAPVPRPQLAGFRDFELLGVLGRGGMGIVYKAKQRGLKRLVALKVILDRLRAVEGVARFRVEAEAIGRLRSEHVVAVHAFGEENGCPYLAMEYLPGGSLKDLLRQGPLPFDRAADVVRQVALGVQAAHEAGIVHRDLKPANVLLDRERVCVADFGLARLLDAADGDTGLTQTGAVMGTPEYLAPEQAEGHTHEAGPAADVWGIGAVLYHCLTGRPPARAANPQQTLRLVREGRPAPPRSLRPDVPADLDVICRKCLQKSPGDRYATAGEVAEELARFLRDEPARATIPSAPRQWLARCGTWRVALVVLAALLGVMGLATAPSKRPIDEETRLAADLDRGRTVLLDRQPRRARLLIGSRSTLLTTDAEGYFTVAASTTSLVELASDPRRDSFRLTAEVRHLRNHHHACRIGLFVGYAEQHRPWRLCQFTALSFNDLNDARQEHDELVRAVKPDNLNRPRPKGNRLTLKPLVTAGLEWAEGHSASASRPGPESFVAAGSEKTPWRTLIVEVTPLEVRAYWGEPQKTFAGALTAAKYVEGLSKAVQSVPAHSKARDAKVAFAARGGVGLYVTWGAASFRNVSIEPLTP